MSEIKKIWALTDGEDYDYHRVLGVFSTYKNALIAAEHCKLAPEDIEEWEMDSGVENINAGLAVFLISMKRDGSITTCAALRELAANTEPFVTFSSFGKRHEYYLYGTVWAHNAAEAVTIADTYRQRFIAEGKWPLPDGWYDVDPQTGELTPA